MSGSVILIRNSLQTKLTDDYGIGNIDPHPLRIRRLKAGSAPSPGVLLALIKSTTPAFKHTINVAANCVSSILAANFPH